jgi:6-phosphogluconolactonase
MKVFENKEILNQSLADALAACIQQAILSHGKAHILLSGGSSPVALYSMLSQIDLPWEKVVIGLVDERFVPKESEFSNERMIRETLLQGAGAKATFLGMVVDGMDYVSNCQHIHELYSPFMQQLDLVVLGMGEDGHTASLFPGDTVSEELLNSAQIGIYNTTSPNEPTRRITCSREMLFRANKTILLLTGNAKKIVFENASANRLPISFWSEEMLDIYYSIQ